MPEQSETADPVRQLAVPFGNGADPVARFVPARSLGGEFTRADTQERRTGQRGAGVSISAGVYPNPCRTTEQSSSNPVDMLFALFVFLFVLVRRSSFYVRFRIRFESLQMR